VPAHLDRTEEDHLLAGSEHVAQERLVEPRRAESAGGVADQRFENLEARTAGGAQTAAQNPGAQRGNLPRLEAGNRLQPAAILVANRKPIEEILEAEEPGARQVGCPARTDAFQILERRGEDFVGL
jgi:hypothetical protein